MAPYSDNLLCRYHYDPLDRLVGTTPLKQNELQRFYCKNRLTTEIQGQVRRSRPRIHQIHRPLPRQCRQQVVHRTARHRFPGLVGGRAHVRRRDHVVHLQ